MKTKMIAALLILFIFLLLTLFSWLYLFNIYEVRVIVSPEYLLTDKNMETEIEIVPLNSFGFKIVFRKIKAEFSIVGGKELIENIAINKDSNKVSIKSNGKSGIIVILIEADFGLFPTIIEIPVVDDISDIKNED